jgi:CHAT domain-containing protein
MRRKNWRKRWRSGLLIAFITLLCVMISPVLGAVSISTNGSSSSVVGESAEMNDWEQQARSLYEIGQFEQAAIAFESASQAYQREGDSLRQALALSNLALCYQQLGAWGEANNAIAQSLAILQQDEPANAQLLAQVFDIQGSLQLSQGQTDASLASWEQAAILYERQGNLDRAIASRVNQSQALQSLGLYRRAVTTLISALKLDLTTLEATNALDTLPVSSAIAAALRSLGEALRVTGNLFQAEAVLQRGFTLAQTLNDAEAIAATQFSLGNVTYAQAILDLSFNSLTPKQAVDLIQKSEAGQRFRNTNIALSFRDRIAESLEFYQQAMSTPSALIRTQAQLNQFNLLLVMQRWTAARALIPQLQQQLQNLPLSRTAIYTKVNFAQSLITLFSETNTPFTNVAQILETAVQQAIVLEDQRSHTYALGMLGSVYEKTQQWQKAERVTQQALLLAQAIKAPDIAYLWQWQLGRVLKSQKNKAAAIAAYKEAVNTLKLLRSDLVAISPDEQFLFRDTIEPIHRELVTLLLDTDAGSPSPDNLKASRDVIESLQLAELDNFFREACLTAKPEQIDQIDDATAVLYPIILNDRLAVVAKLPHQEIMYYATPVQEKITPERIEITVNQLRQFLQQSNTNRANYLPPAQNLYNWLIRPIAINLHSNSVKTLVFVLDGPLRNVPMSALHDGNQFLVENYRIALTPGLQLLETRPLAQERFRVLIAGLTEARAGFSALPNVDPEVQQIEAQIRESRILLNQQFSINNFQSTLNTIPFPIVHIATHGKFSSQLQNTYILTWDSRLNVNQLRTLLQTTEIREGGSLELLVLSACETAAGDSRATLGLAGVAVRAGARSTVATLWQVSDASTSEMMGQLYESLTHPNISKAMALQEAQLKLLHNELYQHPFFWAPYVLIGNWQ